jgi:small subunit ribosomal protein S6
MAFYEHVFIARPDLTTAQVDGLVGDFSKIIADGGGKVAANEYWGLKSLAYRIKKNRKAHYVFFGLDAPHAALAELERKERLDENIIRFLTIRVDALEQGPSAMMRSRSDEFDRFDKDDGEGK